MILRAGWRPSHGPTARRRRSPTTRNRAGRTAAPRAARPRPRCWPSRGSTYTSPNGNPTTIQPDWTGPGPGRQRHRPAGQRPALTTGIPMAWPRWPWTRSIGTRSITYDSEGQHHRASSTKTRNYGVYTYNSDSEPLTSHRRRRQHHELTPTAAWQSDGRRGCRCQISRR